MTETSMPSASCREGAEVTLGPLLGDPRAGDYTLPIIPLPAVEGEGRELSPPEDRGSAWRSFAAVRPSAGRPPGLDPQNVDSLNDVLTGRGPPGNPLASAPARINPSAGQREKPCPGGVRRDPSPTMPY